MLATGLRLSRGLSGLKVANLLTRCSPLTTVQVRMASERAKHACQLEEYAKQQKVSYGCMKFNYVQFLCAGNVFCCTSKCAIYNTIAARLADCAEVEPPIGMV